MKKFTAFLTAAVLLLSVTGCGGEIETITTRRKDGATLEVDMSTAWISEKTNVKTRSNTPVLQTPEGVLLYRCVNRKTSLTHWNAQTGEFTEVERPNADKRYGTCTEFRLTGNRIGVMFERRYAKKWEYDAAAIIEVYDAQMNYTETIEIPAFDGDDQMQFCVDRSSGTDYLVYEYAYNGIYDNLGMAAYNLETGVTTDIQGEGFEPVIGASGTAYCYTYIDGQYYLSRINVQSGRLEPITSESALIAPYSFLVAGTGEYELYLSSNEKVMGISISGDTGKMEKVMDMAASDLLIDLSEGVSFMPSPDGRFFVGNKEGLWLCHSRTEEEKESIKAITLAGVNLKADLRNIVINYNRTHSDYHIFMVDYMDFIDENYFDIYDFGRYSYSGGNSMLFGVSYEDNEIIAAVELFWKDLQNGISPDIICTDNLPYVQFANKGLFLDMSKLMEEDERFNPDDYLMNFFDSMKYQGQQQTIAFSFYLNTIIGETELVGEKAGRTASEYQTLLQSMPENMCGLGYTRDLFEGQFLKYIQNSFLDTETKTCSFDDPAFASILEIGSGLLTEEEWWEQKKANGEDGFGASDYEENALLTVRSFNNAKNYHENYAGEHEFRDITLVGFPTKNGNGGIFSAPYQLAINAMSAYPEEIWGIFMGMLEEEAQRKMDLGDYNSFPVLRSALKEDIELIAKAPNLTYEREGMRISIGAVTEEEQAILLDYIEHVGMFYYDDPTVSSIIQEEADMYFAGDQTAQEAANKIQSRASLYISEQY